MALSRSKATIDIENTIENVSTNLIRITEDKLKLILIENVAKIRKPADIINPLAIIISLLATIITADFKSKWGLPAESWKTLFFTFLVISIIYFFCCLFNLIFKRSNVKRILKEIKNEYDVNKKYCPYCIIAFLKKSLHL